MYRKIILPGVFLIVCMFSVQVKCQSRIPKTQIEQIFSQWNKPGIPGASIAIVQAGKVLFKKGYGTANLEYDIPIGTSTIFQVASVSKQVTALAILLLENNGKLSLNDDVRKYIPELPDFGKVITLRHLMFHTSGLRDYWNILTMAGWQYDDIITKKQILDIIYRQKGLNFQPGSEHGYSNTNYLILAEIVAKVSGTSFADYTRENFFKPLKMNSTLFLDDNEKVVRNFAYSYDLSPDGYKKSLLNHMIVGPTNLLTTVEDMSLWAMNFDNPVVGNKEIIRKMNTGGTLDTGDSISYGMGQETGVYKGIKIVGHEGGERGYRSFIARFPDQHLSIIIFSNNASVEPYDIGLKIADIILKDKFFAEPAVTKVNPAPQPTGEFKGDPEILKIYAGRYELRPGFVISITNENDMLFAEAHEVPKSQLIRTSESDFLLPAMKAKLSFIGDKESISKVVINLNGQQMEAPKLKDFDGSTVNPGDYTGDFYSPELGTVYTFINSGNQLVVKHSRIDDFTLKATESDQFSSDKSFCKRVEFIRDANKNITGCLMSAGRVRYIRFVRII